MRMFPKAGVAVLAAWGLVMGVWLSQSAGPAWARKEYKDQFDAQYKQYYDKAGTKTACEMCHVRKKPKKERNEYGMEYGTKLGATKVKDKKKIEEALTSTEDMDSPVAGKKFVDLIKEGKFPAGNDPQ